MDAQTIIVGLIILTAGLYSGIVLFGKFKSFSNDNSCGAGCGCESKSKLQKKFTQIRRN